MDPEWIIRIVLFGSVSRGEDTSSSDIDLFILSRDPDTTKRYLSSFKMKQRIQPIILVPAELHEFREREKVLFDEIERGIVLWEERE